MSLTELRFSPAEVEQRLAVVREHVARHAPSLHQPNFRRIGSKDLAETMAAYNRHVFDGRLVALINERAAAGLSFRVAPRMTRVGGHTERVRRYEKSPDGRRVASDRYEIAVSSTLLFESFRGDDHRPIVVCGHTCADRLAAYLRIFEHELTHLLELLTFDNSSCKQRRFHGIASGIFGHTAFVHELIRPKERAAIEHGIRVGRWVKFRHDGRELVGMVNRVTRRATVLVPDPKGQLMSDGRKYLTWYVPPGELTVIERP